MTAEQLANTSELIRRVQLFVNDILPVVYDIIIHYDSTSKALTVHAGDLLYTFIRMLQCFLL